MTPKNSLLGRPATPNALRGLLSDLSVELQKTLTPPIEPPIVAANSRAIILRSGPVELAKKLVHELSKIIPADSIAIIDRESLRSSNAPHFPGVHYIAYPGEANYAPEAFQKIAPSIGQFQPTLWFFISPNPTAAGYDNVMSCLGGVTEKFWAYTIEGKFLRFTQPFLAARQKAIQLEQTLYNWQWERLRP